MKIAFRRTKKPSPQVDVCRGEQKREDWIDMIKGIGMLCVITGHMSIPYELRKFIYAFHMPLFFFVSGYLYKGTVSGAWIVRKVDSLIIPYCIYSAIMLLMGCTCLGLDYRLMLHNFLTGFGVGETWFLTCLFFAEVIGAGILYYEKKMDLNLCGVILCAVVGWAALWFKLPACAMLGRIMIAASFFILGNYTAQIKRRHFSAVPKPMILLAMLVGFVVSCVLSQVQHVRVDMASFVFGNVFLFYITSLLMIGVLFVSCNRIIPAVRAVGFIGRNSLLFMMWHSVVPPVMLVILARLGLDVDSSVSLKVASRLLNGFVLLLIVWFLARYVPLLSGRAKYLTRFLNS